MSNLKITVKSLKLCQRANVPVLIEGVHGVGKSSVLHQLYDHVIAELAGVKLEMKDLKSSLDGRELANRSDVPRDGYGYWMTAGGSLTIEEAIGMPNVSPELVLTYLRSGKFIPPADHKGGGIWLIEELNLAGQDVRNALLSIILEGRFLDYVLPTGIFIVAGQNPAAGEYQGAPLAPPMVNRFCVLKFTVEHNEVLEYFRAREFDDTIIECLMEHHEKCLNPHQKLEFDNNQVPTSRSWEFVNRIMKVATPEEVTDKSGFFLNVLSGLLGPSAAATYQKFAEKRGDRVINIDEVLTGYGWRQDLFGGVDNEPTLAEFQKEFPENKLRRQVLALTRKASMRADILSVALEVLVDRVHKISERVSSRLSDAEKGLASDDRVDVIGKKLDAQDRLQLMNAYAFLLDCPRDMSGTNFMRRLEGMDAVYTFEPLVVEGQPLALLHAALMENMEDGMKVDETKKD